MGIFHPLSFTLKELFTQKCKSCDPLTVGLGWGKCVKCIYIYKYIYTRVQTYTLNLQNNTNKSKQDNTIEDTRRHWLSFCLTTPTNPIPLIKLGPPAEARKLNLY